MVRDRRQSRLMLPRTPTGFATDVSPYPGLKGARDPLVKRLRSVRCRDAAVTAGHRGRSVVRIVMHAWNGDRGIVLARQVARLDRKGCDVRVLYGKGTGRVVKRIFERSGIPARDSGVRTGRRVHHKVMLVSGAVGGHPDAHYVWTVVVVRVLSRPDGGNPGLALPIVVVRSDRHLSVRRARALARDVPLDGVHRGDVVERVGPDPLSGLPEVRC
jgi:hypothetical protein